jgi:acyl dehydratase
LKRWRDEILPADALDKSSTHADCEPERVVEQMMNGLKTRSTVTAFRGTTFTDIREAMKTVEREATRTGEKFSKEVYFDSDNISVFAKSAGDTNPLHHDPEFAANSRFGGIIASGSHVTALMMGMVADYFTDKGTNVGLDFSFRFQAPVRAGDTIVMRWTITESMPKLSLRGDIITLEGEAVRENGIIAVSSTAHALLLQR